MSGNNDQPNVEALALVALGMAFVAVFFVAYFLLILAAFVGSMISLYGWTRDIEFGATTIRKEYCRAFIPLGVVGEILIALLITFIEGAGIAVERGRPISSAGAMPCSPWAERCFWESSMSGLKRTNRSPFLFAPRSRLRGARSRFSATPNGMIISGGSDVPIDHGVRPVLLDV